MLWIALTIAAAPLQVARNALQRGLVEEAGPWGATLVRFLFGLPFALAMFAVVALATPDADPHPGLRFVATFTQQASLPAAALLGLFVLHDGLSPAAWAGVAVTTCGVAILSWPGRISRLERSGLWLGVASGVVMAVVLNAYRQSAQALDADHPIYAAIASVCVAQAIQSLGLGAWLAVRRPQALRAVVSGWRSSWGAGFCGAAASACWFAARGLAPAGPVRAIGVLELPIAAAAGRRLFQERLGLRQLVGGAATAAGVVLAALG